VLTFFVKKIKENLAIKGKKLICYVEDPFEDSGYGGEVKLLELRYEFFFVHQSHLPLGTKMS
jgi:hypothetical protein